MEQCGLKFGHLDYLPQRSISRLLATECQCFPILEEVQHPAKQFPDHDSNTNQTGKTQAKYQEMVSYVAAPKSTLIGEDWEEFH